MNPYQYKNIVIQKISFGQKYDRNKCDTCCDKNNKKNWLHVSYDLSRTKKGWVCAWNFYKSNLLGRYGYCSMKLVHEVIKFIKEVLIYKSYSR